MLRHFLIQRIAMLGSMLTGVAGRTLPYIGGQTALGTACRFDQAALRIVAPDGKRIKNQRTERDYR